MNLCITREKILFPAVLHYISWVSLSLSLLLVSNLCFLTPFYLPASSLIQAYLLFLFLQLSCRQPSFQGYFPLFYWFPPFPYSRILTFRVFVLFKLSQMHSMRQRLGGSPLINAEVKIFTLLTYSERSPEILDTRWK